MPDNARIQMCKDGAGQWHQVDMQNSPAMSAASGFPARAQVSYRGTFRFTASEKTPINMNNILGSLLSSAMKTNSRQIAGQINIELTVNRSVIKARISGTDLTMQPMSGTVRDSYCRLATDDTRMTITYEGRCNAQSFVGQTHGTAGEIAQKGDFDAQVVQLVDLDERDRQAAVAAVERQKAEAAQRAAYLALPNAGPILTKRFDGFVAADSRGWAFNRYDAGSLTNVKVVSGSSKSGSYVMRGEYTYNGGSGGWVMAKMSAGKLGCIQFWDAVVGCRELRTAAQGQAMRNLAVQSVTGGGGGGRSDERCDSNCQVYRDKADDLERQGSRIPPPPSYTPPPVEPIGGDRGLYGSDHSCC